MQQLKLILNRKIDQDHSNHKLAYKQNFNPANNDKQNSQSYLSAMRALQQKLQNMILQNQSIKLNLQEVVNQNNKLKNLILENEKQKLETQTNINNILRDYNTLKELLEQTRLQNMIFKKQLEQLRIQKKNVLEKVTEKMCKERVVSVLEDRENQKRRYKGYNSTKKYENTYQKLQKYQKPYDKMEQTKFNKQGLFDTSYKYREPMTEILMTNRTSNYNLLSDKHLNQNLSQRTSNQNLLTHRTINSIHSPRIELNYQSSYNSNYLILLKEIMKKQKLMVSLNHQLQRLERQLIEQGQKQDLMEKIKVLNEQIRVVKRQLQQARNKQNKI